MAPSILKEVPGSLKRLQVYLEVVHGIHDGLRGCVCEGSRDPQGTTLLGRLFLSSGISRFFFPNKLYGVCCPTMQHSQSKNGSGGGGGVRSWRRQMLVKLRHPEWKDITYCSGNVFIDDKNKENKTHVSGQDTWQEVHVVFTSCVGCLLGSWFTRYPAESFGSNIFLFSFNPVRFVLLLFKIFVHFNVFFLITVWSLRRCAWDFSRSF